MLPLPAASSSTSSDLYSALAVVLVTVLDDDERQFPPLEVELDDLLPEEEPDLLLALVHQHARRRQPQRVLRPVLALRLNISMKMVTSNIHLPISVFTSLKYDNFIASSKHV